MSNDFLSGQDESFKEQAATSAGFEFLGKHLHSERSVGDLLKIDYSEGVVLVHDHMRKAVTGLPMGCFLVASRVEPGSSPNPEEEETSAVLLRILGPAQLPNAMETDGIRFAIGQRVAKEDLTWDHPDRADQYTLHLLRYSGLRCRVLGTFSVKKGPRGAWRLSFGADLANFYSGRGMKVYKPNGDLLNTIANFVRPYGADRHPLAGARIGVGRVRYAASERSDDSTALTNVTIDPTDLLARRSALFGMSRTGKSNTTKIIAKAVFQLRKANGAAGRVGQLILDPNGEYANQNAQDRGSIRGIATTTPNAEPNDIVTYGLHPHPRDPQRRLIKLNFFGALPTNVRDREAVVNALIPMIRGKEIIDAALAKETVRYIVAFRNVSLDVPEIWDDSSRTRYLRMIAAYRAILVSAGFASPPSMATCDLGNLTNEALRTAISSSSPRAASIFNKGRVSWEEAFEAMNALREAINDPAASGYGTFNDAYKNSHEGRDWHDTNLVNILALMEYRGGLRVLGQLSDQHSPNTDRDYADEIVEHLHKGRLVIVDQSTGDPVMNKAASERLMWAVFDAQKNLFTNPKEDKDGNLVQPPEILVYVEEAHNLLPAKSEDLTSVWSRTAKEGSKYRIGLVYATQEPSSIQSNILKNTDNWFVAHLNNADEVRELRKYYDFDDFTQQILSVPEPGFLRLRTLSNPYIVPVQIEQFRVSEE